MATSPIGLIVATHGDLASVLVETTEMVLGRTSTLHAFTFHEGEDARTSSERLQALVRKSEKGSGVIIMADLFGGTPGSLALSMLDEPDLEVITGVNLPMAVTAATLDSQRTLREASEALVTAGREAIKAAGTLLGS